MSVLVTYRGCVNTWDCDQMGHQNVQFYVAKAADAQAALCCALGLTPSQLRRSGTAVLTFSDRILFKRELHAGHAVCIRSGVRDARGAAIRYFSVMTNEETDEQAATFETTATLVDLKSGQPIDLPPEATARAADFAATTVDHPPPSPIEGVRAPLVTPQQSLLTHRGTLESWECDETGYVTTRFQIARFSEAGIQLLSQMGLSKPVLRSRNLGAAAVDYAIEYHAALRPGLTVDVRSGVLEVRNKVVRFFHHLIDSAQGEIATTIEVALVFFDLAARKSVAMPEEIAVGARALMARDPLARRT